MCVYVCMCVCATGPVVARAAAYTAGIVGGLTLTAMCAPSEKYLNMGGPLALGLGVVLVSSIGKNHDWNKYYFRVFFRTKLEKGQRREWEEGGGGGGGGWKAYNIPRMLLSTVL